MQELETQNGVAIAHMTHDLPRSIAWQGQLGDLDSGVQVTFEAPLARLTTLRIGGPAECLVRVSTVAGLRAALAVVSEHGLPFFLLGQGSNVLIPDDGLAGVVVRLEGYFRRSRYAGARVSAGGAVPLARLAKETAKRGLAGLEALSGFPSTVGGAVFMNAGCYGTEIKDLLIRAAVVDRQGDRRLVTPDELEPGYRQTVLSRTGEIVVHASFQLVEGDPTKSLERINELNRRRWQSLPSGAPNAGSIFRNPPEDYAGRLIESVGLKGEVRGGAAISERHANVIVNRGGASADDVLALMLRARDRVAAEHGVELEPEVVLAGSLQQRWRHGGNARP